MPIEEKDLTKNKRWKNNERKENKTFKQEHKKTSRHIQDTLLKE